MENKLQDIANSFAKSGEINADDPIQSVMSECFKAGWDAREQENYWTDHDMLEMLTHGYALGQMNNGIVDADNYLNAYKQSKNSQTWNG